MTDPVYDRWGVSVYHGDNLDVLREMPDCSVDSVVTDPPAGIAFMGKAWDTDRGGRREWVAWLTERMVETWRVLKPGGHALVWSMPRTSHWTGWALDDAGFEIRDVVQHCYEQGFPKSLDVAKAIDARGGRPELASQVAAAITAARQSRGWTTGQADRHFCGGSTNWTWYEGRRGVCRPPTAATFARIAAEWPELEGLAREIEQAEREVVGYAVSGIGTAFGDGQWARGGAEKFAVTAPATIAARTWKGWGTALRPAAEPWWMARKPLMGRTVAQSVVVDGTGAVNIDATRGPDGQWPANVAKFPKAPPSERPMVDGQQHPTVKSVALCRWLVRLVTPPGGTVLDLFAGTGSVGQAARAEGFKAVLIEQDEQSIGFIKARLDARPKTEAGQASNDEQSMDLLDLLGGDAS